MPEESRRLARERKTFRVMVELYCREKHGSQEAPCAECRELLDYANLRLDKCPFRERKPTCANCTIHCYKPAMRERVKTVMRFAGPRLMREHPFLSLMHLADGLRKPPPKKHRGR